MLWGAQELSVMRPFPSFGLIPKVRAGQWIPVPWHLSSQILCICAPTYIHIFVHISMDTQTLQAREDVDYRRNSIAICQVPLSGLVRIFYYYFCSALVGGHPNEREEGKPELCTSQRWQWKHLCAPSKCDLQTSLAPRCSFRQRLFGKHFTAPTVFSMLRRDSCSQLCKCFNWDSCLAIQVTAFSSGPHRPKCIYISTKCPKSTQYFSLEHTHGTWLPQSTGYNAKQ